LRIIHISTDAIFSNNARNVDESSLASPQGIYGETKLLGEISGSGAITIRCSFVGPAVAGLNQSGLWSWVQNLGQGECIRGFQNHQWAGVTINQLIHLCDLLVDKQTFHEVSTASSIHHFCPNPVITKYCLVSLIAKQIRPDIIVEPKDDNVAITRNLVSKYNSLNKLIVKDEISWKLLIREAALGYKN
jgi:dTDP-4-dehydrorhamnose reductase